MKVTKESIIGEVLDEAPETAKFFIEIGMHCLGCAIAHGETVGEAGLNRNFDTITIRFLSKTDDILL